LIALPTELLPSLRVAEELPDRRGPQRTFADVKVDRGISKLAASTDDATAAVERFLAER